MRRAVRLSLISLLALFLLTAGGVVWLTMSESGLQTALRLVSAFSGERLESVGASGRLAGPLAIEKLRWADGDLRIEIEQLRLDWSPAALWENRLQIDRVACAKLAIISQPSATPPTPPPSLLLPLAVAIDDLAIARIDYNALITLSEVSGRLASDGRQHRLDAWRAVSGDSVLQAAATVDGAAPPALTAQGEIASRLAGQPVALGFAVSGPLEKMALRVDGK
ncbi:MAG: hypothetical protein LBV49_06155, partial [Azonexus sp.]|nr:hypothetical protein [Azonexus sp.]